MVDPDALAGHRRETYRLDRPIKTRQQAIEFVNERRYAFFWPITGIEMPSLWAAVAGDRPVPNEHDDPGHVTWGWKDELLGQHKWYYAKLLRKRATMVSLDFAPHFYALTENYGAPEEDYLIEYEAGRLTQEAKQIYEALLKEGPLDTVALRRAARLTSRESKSPFDRALTVLQVDMKILPVGVAEAGAWNYAFEYDLVPRHLPEIPERARRIKEKSARLEILRRYLESVGGAPLSQARKLFPWEKADFDRAVLAGVEEGWLTRGGQGREAWIALSGLSST